MERSASATRARFNEALRFWNPADREALPSPELFPAKRSANGRFSLAGPLPFQSRSASFRMASGKLFPPSSHKNRLGIEALPPIYFSQRPGWNPNRGPKRKRFISRELAEGSASDWNAPKKGSAPLLENCRTKRFRLRRLFHSEALHQSRPAFFDRPFTTDARKGSASLCQDLSPAHSEGSASFLDPDPGESAFPINRSASPKSGPLKNLFAEIEALPLASPGPNSP